MDKCKYITETMEKSHYITEQISKLINLVIVTVI